MELVRMIDCCMAFDITGPVLFILATEVPIMLMGLRAIQVEPVGATSSFHSTVLLPWKRGIDL